MVRDPHTQDSRGFAFVTFETVEDADAALATLNGYELGGRHLTVQKARRVRPHSPTPGQGYKGPESGRSRGRRYDDRGIFISVWSFVFYMDR